MKQGKIAVIYNEVTPDAGPDELDILDQVKLVSDSLVELGYETCTIPIGFNIQAFIDSIHHEKPGLAFNLTESIQNHGELLYFAPAVLNLLRIPYTGVRTEGIFLTTSKTLAKNWMRNKGLPTADWFELDSLDKLDPIKTYLLKPTLEDGSLGFDEEQVFLGKDAKLKVEFGKLSKGHFFIEEYIEGREFNISMLCSDKGPEILPIAEIQFIDFPQGKPKIIGYRAKWVDDSFESKNTVRVFMDEKAEHTLAARLRQTCFNCWDAFQLRGYVRIDIRLDGTGNIFILEINANPCISPGAGFYAACEKAGYRFTQVCERIIDDALR